jgi:hypothetical protein
MTTRQHTRLALRHAQSPTVPRGDYRLASGRLPSRRARNRGPIMYSPTGDWVSLLRIYVGLYKP